MSGAWRHFVRRTLVAYWLFLFCATHFPKLELPGPRQSDKFYHFVAYAVLGGLAWLVRTTWKSPANAWSGVLIFGLIALYAAVDELTQPIMGRSGDPYDWAADVAGAAVGMAVAAFVLRRRRG